MASITVEQHSWREWDRVASEWDATVERSDNASFYVTAEWVDAWLSAFGDLLQPEVLTFHAGDRMVGGCVLIDRRQWVKGVPLRRLHLNCSGEDDADSTCIEHNVLMAERGFEAAVQCAFLESLGERRWDELLLDGLAGDDVTPEAADQLGGVESEERRAPYADLAAIRASGQTLLMALPKKTRHQLRRTMKYYEESSGCEPRLEVACTTGEAVAYLDELAALHDAVWRQRGQAGAFASPLFTRVHRALVANAFPRGRVALLRTRVGDQTVGVLYTFLFRGRVYAYQSGFRYTSDNRPSPGLLSHYLAMAHFLEKAHNVEYDFGAGESDYKRALTDASRTLRWVVVRRRTAAEFAFLGARAIKRRCQAWTAATEPTV